MPRIRSVKPDFFRHELLQELEASRGELKPMLVFSGLWTVCDKAGRFEWKPRTLKLDILPFLEFDMADTLELLRKNAFIKRYKADGRDYGFIPTFLDHQRITGKEHDAPSKYPDPPKEDAGETPGKQPGIDRETPGCPGREGKGREGKGTDDSLGKHPDPQDIRLVQLLIDLMLKNNPKSTVILRLTENRQEEWIDQCRLLRTADGKTPEEIERVIAFSQTDSFWKSNILSMPKLREKWDMLWMKAQRGDPMAGIREWLIQKEKEYAGK